MLVTDFIALVRQYSNARATDAIEILGRLADLKTHALWDTLMVRWAFGEIELRDPQSFMAAYDAAVRR